MDSLTGVASGDVRSQVHTGHCIAPWKGKASYVGDRSPPFESPRWLVKGDGEGVIVFECHHPYRPGLGRVGAGEIAPSCIHMPYISQASARMRDAMHCYLWCLWNRATDYLSVNALKKPRCQKPRPPCRPLGCVCYCVPFCSRNPYGFSCPLQAHLWG